MALATPQILPKKKKKKNYLLFQTFWFLPSPSTVSVWSQHRPPSKEEVVRIWPFSIIFEQLVNFFYHIFISWIFFSRKKTPLHFNIAEILSDHVNEIWDSHVNMFLKSTVSRDLKKITEGLTFCNIELFTQDSFVLDTFEDHWCYGRVMT